MEYREFEKLMLDGTEIDSCDRGPAGYVIRQVYQAVGGEELTIESARPFLEAFRGGSLVATMRERTAALREAEQGLARFK